MRNVILVLVAVFCFGCSKYDENPAVSLFPKKVRITGTWLVKSYVDKDLGEVEVDEEQSEAAALELKWNGSGKQGESELTWYFSNDKESLVVSYNDDPGVFYKQHILKLTNKELWLGTIEEGYSKSEKE